jgi:hypothetical protein
MLRRNVWEAVGGFPDQRAAEDLAFMERINESSFRIAWAPDATVWWRLQPTLSSTFRKFLTYSEHNVVAGREWDWHYGIAKKYILSVPFFALAFVHSPWWLIVPSVIFLARVAKRIWDRREGRALRWLLNPAQFFGVFVIMIAIDVATFAGWLIGLHQKTQRTQKEGSSPLLPP